MGIKIWLDDERPTPYGYKLCRTAEEVISLLEQHIKMDNTLVDTIDLDNDLGSGYTEGRKVAQWVEEQASAGKLKRLDCYAHTDNPSAYREMIQCFRNADKYWRQTEGG
jgi:hypothetical protein